MRTKTPQPAPGEFKPVPTPAPPPPLEDAFAAMSDSQLRVVAAALFRQADLDWRAIQQLKIAVQRLSEEVADLQEARAGNY